MLGLNGEVHPSCYSEVKDQYERFLWGVLSYSFSCACCTLYVMHIQYIAYCATCMQVAHWYLFLLLHTYDFMEADSGPFFLFQDHELNISLSQEKRPLLS